MDIARNVKNINFFVVTKPCDDDDDDSKCFGGDGDAE